MPSFGASDPVFGDGQGHASGSPAGSQAGSGLEDSDEEEPFFLDEITATRQTIYIVDEDLQLLFEGWGEKTYKALLWKTGEILTFGGLSLLGKWLPDWWLSGRGKTREFGRASQVVVKTSHGTTYVVPIKTLSFSTAVPISVVFPPSSSPPPTSRNDEASDSSITTAIGNGNTTTAKQDDTASVGTHEGINGHQTPASTRSRGTKNGTQTPGDSGSLKTGKSARLKDYKYVDFRYYRFLLHPVSGNFHMLTSVYTSS